MLVVNEYSGHSQGQSLWIVINTMYETHKTFKIDLKAPKNVLAYW